MKILLSLFSMFTDLYESHQATKYYANDSACWGPNTKDNLFHFVLDYYEGPGSTNSPSKPVSARTAKN